MEITEIEKLWQLDNQRLEKSLVLNEQLLLKVKAVAVDDFKIFLKFAVLGRNMAFVYFLISTVLSSMIISDLKYSIPGFLGAFFMLLSFFYHLAPLEKIRKLKYYTMPVVDLQKIISEFRVRSIEAAKYDFMVVAVWFVTIFPIYKFIFFKSETYANTQDTLTFFLISVAFVGILFPVNQYIYKKKCGVKLKAAETALEEVAKFDSSEGRADAD